MNPKPLPVIVAKSIIVSFDDQKEDICVVHIDEPLLTPISMTQTQPIYNQDQDVLIIDTNIHLTPA